MKLPEDFLAKMSKLLSEKEFEEFLSSYKEPRHYGLRVNTLKIALHEFCEISPFAISPVPWTSDGFYYSVEQSPGRHPYYHAGLYYIQEPSAMLPGYLIDARPGEKILDLCAAPGGKTVQIAAGMKGEGLLVANDISAERVKALIKNIELMGVRNAVVSNETPEKLATRFTGFFDKILVDAPCSGEGMFRKDEDAIKSWEKYKCEKCVGMQRSILESADKMLKAGGVIVYSTCTFSPEEDEGMISEFIDKNKNYEVLHIEKTAGMEDGRPQWCDGKECLSNTVRLWPHRIKGEGHFAALIRKKDGNSEEIKNVKASIPYTRNHHAKKEKISTADPLKAFSEFCKENLKKEINGVTAMGDNIYSLPFELPDMSGIKLSKKGWYLGSASGGRFEPSHSMIVSMNKDEIINTIDFSSGSKEVNSYLKGETIMYEGKKGYVGICVDGFTLGWAKGNGDILKNLYPKGWRKMT